MSPGEVGQSEAAVRPAQEEGETLFQSGDGPVQMSAITAGGSQALFFKINTWGEEAFLDKLRELV